MITTFVMFENDKDLQKLTGLTDDQLWEAGFNLDDWDWGFACDKKLVTAFKDEDGYITRRYVNGAPAYARYILDWMDNYCVGYRMNEYKGRYYYMLYHS